MDCALVALRETEFFPQAITDQTGELYCVYLYTPETATFCCEITPSYDLEPLYYVSEHRASDALNEQLMDAIGDPCYVHCRTIKAKPDTMKTHDEFESLEEAREYWQGNTWEPTF